MEKLYSSIEELNLMLALYPAQKESILEEAGKKFKLDGENAWFVVAEDGNCGLFDEKYNLDDITKVKSITPGMILHQIKRINIPDSVENIEESAFRDFKTLENINIPDSVKDIGNSAFFGCESLIDIVLPDSVINIKEWTFAHCESLKNITMPNYINNIGEYAFYMCKSLEKIIIPYFIKNIGNAAFRKCYSLKEIMFKHKTIDKVWSMKNYPWDVINDESIIKSEL